MQTRNMTTLHLRIPIGWPPLRLRSLLVALTLACFALSPQVRGTCREGCDIVKFNTFLGDDALVNNTTGFGNTAIGSSALLVNTTGTENTAPGASALARNTTGSENTASGFHALLNNTTGNKNIALGFRAGSDLTTGDNNIDIGNPGQPGESSTIRIGRVEEHTATF